jgi:hypothetical protein
LWPIDGSIAARSGAIASGQGQSHIPERSVGSMIVPQRMLGRGLLAPSDTVNVAVVSNGMGAPNARAVMGHNIAKPRCCWPVREAGRLVKKAAATEVDFLTRESRKG